MWTCGAAASSPQWQAPERPLTDATGLLRAEQGQQLVPRSLREQRPLHWLQHQQEPAAAGLHVPSDDLPQEAELRLGLGVTTGAMC